MNHHVISPASFSRVLGHLVSCGALSAREAVLYRSGKVPALFALPLPHGALLRHSSRGYVIDGAGSRDFQADLAWALA